MNRLSRWVSIGETCLLLMGAGTMLVGLRALAHIVRKAPEGPNGLDLIDSIAVLTTGAFVVVSISRRQATRYREQKRWSEEFHQHAIRARAEQLRREAFEAAVGENARP